MSDCIFCMIINGKICADVLYEDDAVIAFKDIKPSAPVHVLVMPKKHIKDILAFSDEDSIMLSNVVSVIKKVAKMTGVNEKGFRVINNCGHNAGQTIEHVHFHVLGGKFFGEKLL